MTMPTIKQKILASKMVENGGNMGMAMIEAGYSKSMARNPYKVIESKGFQYLLAKYLPENLVLKTHRELLRAVKLGNYIFPLEATDKEIKKIIGKVSGFKFIKTQRNKKYIKVYFTAPDFHSRKDGVDMAYKIRGQYSPEKIDVNSQKIEDALDRLAQILPSAGD